METEPRESDPKKQMLTVRLQPDLCERLKARAKEKHITVTDLVALCVIQGLDNENTDRLQDLQNNIDSVLNQVEELKSQINSLNDSNQRIQGQMEFIQQIFAKSLQQK